MKLHLKALAGRFAVARLAADAGWPHWATGSRGFLSISRTAYETSVICEEGRVPPTVQAERGFVSLVVEGPLDFSVVGVMAALTAPLAAAAIPILAVSTYDTDVLLVRASQLPLAEQALQATGVRVTLDALGAPPG